MKISQRSAWGLSAFCSHLRIDQKTRAVKKAEVAYTSPSTALYQKESQKVYARPPTTPVAMMIKVWRRSGSAVKEPPITSFRAKWVIDQNRKRIERPLPIALIKFTPLAAVCGLSPKRIMKKRPMRTNNGAPGGWGICSL